ncbi:MAG: hypothetical protein FWD08_06425, partial [Alphaproteobacteria bacterium]|nr:hypothetical protein [Alphaproteobacteria bacterium]
KRLFGAALILTSGAVVPNPAQAGFFDFLFAPFQAPEGPSVYERVPTIIHRPRVRVHAPHPHRAAAASKKLIVTERSGPRHAPTRVDLMDDDSLRRGDAVMTQDGIRIFVGPSGDHHQPEDFQAVTEIKNLSKRERQALVGLDRPLAAKQSPKSTTSDDLLTGRSAADGKITTGETITDPNGRMIRYVGP